jgi:cellulose synthase/poly-beta-1,6-N-acetylglucosamine synthase-like glycosyltransferase
MPLENAEADGYIVVGEKIDPRDWDTRSPAQIERIAMEEKDFGNIMLLHDGGGDRSATVAALPRIIDELRSQGYRFLSLSELLGKSRDELMPVPSQDELRWANAEGGLLVTKSKLSSFIGVLFGAVICLTLIRSLIYGALSVVQKRRTAVRKFDPQFAPPVSVIIAAYNEEKVILRTVRSILYNGYEAQFEVLVVDDGSEDGTLGLLKTTFADDKRLRILSQPNRGKAAALNRAIAQAQHEILIALDADTIFAPGTMAKLVRHLADTKVAAVSGNIKIGNKRKWLTRFQALEYIYGFNLDRRALESMNAMTVVPGAAGAWSKSAVLQCGGFSIDTIAEDTDLTLAIRRRGFEFRYDEEAVAYTEAPETISDLVRQRLRWAFGTLQSAWKHRDAMFNPRFGTMAFVTLPSIWLYQVILSAISPVAEIAIFLAIFRGNAKIVLAYYLVFLLLELLTGLFAYSLEKENASDLWILPFQRIFYPHLMLYVVGRAVVCAVTGGLLGWTRARRRASVEEPIAVAWVLPERSESSVVETE